MEFKTTWEYCFICGHIVEHLNGHALSHTPKGFMYGVSEMALHEPVCKIDPEYEDIDRQIFEDLWMTDIEKQVEDYFESLKRKDPIYRLIWSIYCVEEK